jgi:hypothetical protein
LPWEGIEVDSAHDEVRILASFFLEPRAIPAAVGCRACGRLHFPERVPVRAMRRSDPVGEAEEVMLELVCPRCQARGWLRAGGRSADETTRRLVVTLMQQSPCESHDVTAELDAERAGA